MILGESAMVWVCCELGYYGICYDTHLKKIACDALIKALTVFLNEL
jgi:hypothetical protein